MIFLMLTPPLSYLNVLATLSASGLPGWLSGKDSACKAGDAGSIPEWGRSPGEGNGCPLQYSCLGNPVDTRAWRTTIHGVAKESNTT